MSNILDLDAIRRADPCVVARRIVERRNQLGLEEDRLAYEAAMSPQYLRHLLAVGPAFDPGGFARIVGALRMTWSEVLEGRADAPPGQPDPASHPLLLHLTEPQCWELLGTHGIGRIGLPVEPAPIVLPVNYAVDAGTVVYRTAAEGAAAPRAGAPVSFQVDHIDDRRSRGWSVLMVGEAQHVGDPAEQERLAALPGATPWAGGSRPLWVRIRPYKVTGRRIGTE
ncbi:pyridoxamine 5'-phosphate oxidase family protein [Streptomyces sp. FH025]|uniref:pyridoxamine 5'-phosphate oxidase family protein n=1 Tax=Streptomyces sp. FH025 TaxID=2815937 RepID=UPI001A9D902F|nr:pyridoxamine 5'-phosphate oxidase family protein [Streptomyces sp. FH025]MBO1414500.1 pyridoxamine 5'-phosphate oxidase family protein [Streptomyces sp. FH025]